MFVLDLRVRSKRERDPDDDEPMPFTPRSPQDTLALPSEMETEQTNPPNPTNPTNATDYVAATPSTHWLTERAALLPVPELSPMQPQALALPPLLTSRLTPALPPTMPPLIASENASPPCEYNLNDMWRHAGLAREEGGVARRDPPCFDGRAHAIANDRANMVE